MIFTLGACLQEQKKTDLPELGEDMPSRVFVTTEAGAKATLEQAQMRYEGEVQLSDIGFCKVENQQECMIGSFYIPKLLDLLGKRYAILFFVNEKNIVLVDNSDFSYRLIRRIQRKKMNREMTKEKFLYFFITEFIHRDLELLVQYEKRLMEMEERIAEGHAAHFLSDFSPVRKELLTLRSYYDELMDLGKAGTVNLHIRPVKRSDFASAYMVIAATNDWKLNDEIHRVCREEGIYVNVASDRESCDFYFPGIYMRDEMVVGVTASGLDHKKAKRVREEIQKALEKVLKEQDDEDEEK